MSPRQAFAPLLDFAAPAGYRLLPFRFARIPGVPGKVLVTSEVGEFAFISEEDLRALVAGTLDPGSNAYADLQARHVLVESNSHAAMRMSTSKYRTRKSFLKGGPALHMFVVTLRCDHSCRYCQVSRRSGDEARFDMSTDTAAAAVDLMFQSPSPSLTVEFQGGEPLLAFGRIQQVVDLVEERRVREGRAVTYSMTSTLHLADEEMLAFMRRHDFQLSTSLDGPAALHDANRPLPSRDSHARTVAAIDRVRATLGHQSLSALTTLTRESLRHPEAVVDEYVRLGFPSVFLRPLSPFGFAAKSAGRIGYAMEEFLPFYEKALAHIVDLNRRGVVIQEAYAGFLLTHILTPFPIGYVDLRSPTGAGLGARVYNYDGGVYASDEGRMLAEMGDHSFRLGYVQDSHADLLQSDAMQLILAAGVAESLPGCSDCAFLPYCGADPVFNLAREGDPVGHRAGNAHCTKHTGLFQILFRYLAEADPEVMRIFLSWATRRPARGLAAAVGEAA
ncbi:MULTISPECIES: His-Xaa-Ser system radical SAM maturase HxsB [unclassified Azospirillum]|uniref:His-Xaa-Ser system radical SAM maturase HxsB n=1 Tax=unclassified Azospirillum TaxID=2630922 RepID=UPI000B738B72|nr:MULTISPECIES: His-Xaa-Ser system radical SAM maturase HxsB [unclassified Azospirillum]SNS88013.1 His-Xaa-Ser system radical SAM maturase HxsB [Azospirillum sp. RU38E]SNT04977.1 His-Xaa-Ser system radical SAM maturase HxsB [Azospirillum sp. RU37A]